MAFLLVYIFLLTVINIYVFNFFFLQLDDCTAFMQLFADSGQGLIGSKITQNYFMKNVRYFKELVYIYIILSLYYFSLTISIF